MLGQPFDPQADLDRWEHSRPHWAQSGVMVFITFRTNDSIPRSVVARWDCEKASWLNNHGINCSDWRTGIEHLTKTTHAEFEREFRRHKEVFLDTCHGACELRVPAIAKIVGDSLLKFDGDRYRMGDFIVMPNHVHLLASFADAQLMKTQIPSWLRYTARKINLQIGKTGSYWHEEPFDHLVRSAEQYDAIRKYIADNPLKANLRPGEYLYRRLPD